MIHPLLVPRTITSFPAAIHVIMPRFFEAYLSRRSTENTCLPWSISSLPPLSFKTAHEMDLYKVSIQLRDSTFREIDSGSQSQKQHIIRLKCEKNSIQKINSGSLKLFIRRLLHCLQQSELLPPSWIWSATRRRCQVPNTKRQRFSSGFRRMYLSLSSSETAAFCSKKLEGAVLGVDKLTSYKPYKPD